MAARYGFYDIDYIFGLYKWEFESLIKGVRLAQIDEMESTAVNLFHERYVMNAKKPKFNKVFNRKKMESKLEKDFIHPGAIQDKERRLELIKRAQQAFG